MAIVKLNRKFINDGNTRLGRNFSNALVGYDKAADIYKRNNTKYDHPVIESVCYYASDNPECDLLSDVNSVLEKKKLSGFQLMEGDLQFISIQSEVLNGK